MSSGLNHTCTAIPVARRLSLFTVALLMAATPAHQLLAAEVIPPAPRSVSDYRFAIGQQPMVSALNAFSHVTGWQVGMSAELAKDVISPGVHASLPADRALDTLLSGTNLTYRKLSDNNVVIERRTTGAMALQQITISATRSAQDVNSVPSTVTVQDRQQLDRNDVNNIKDLVRYEPGISVGGAGQRAGLTGYNIRGIDGDRVLTQVDGVQVPDSFFNGPYAQTNRNYVDPEIVKRVEILRGPASVLYGSNAIGGAVSYYTLDPDDIIKPGKDVGARLKTGYSSADDSWLTSGTVAGRTGDFDGLLHLSQRNGHETESYGETGGTGLNRTKANPEDLRTTNVLAKLGWNYADDARLGLTYEHYKGDRDTNQLSAVGGPFNAGRGFGFYKSRTGNDTVTRERFGLEHSFALDTALADNIKWSLNYQIAKTDQTTQEIYAPSRTVLRARETTYKDRQWVLDTQADKSLAIADTDHRVTYGTTIKQDKVTGLRTGTGTCLTVAGTCTAAGAISTADTLSPASDFPDPTVNSYSLYAQDEIKWGQWTFMPGIRYDYIQMKPHITEEFLNTATVSGDTVSTEQKNWHKASPKLGVTYAFNDNYTWYGQYAEGFRTPTAKALYGRFENTSEGYTVAPNPNLKPESSKSFESGLRGQFDHGNFDLAVYYNKYKDFIDENFITPGYTETTFQSVNIKKATIKGAEAKGRLNLDYFGLPSGLYTKASIAYAYGRNEDTGEPLNSINPLTSVFGLGYEQDNYGGLLNWTLVKRKSRVDSTNFNTPDGTSTQFKTPGYGVLDLAGFYKVTDDVTINAGLYNLTNKKYWQWDDVRGYDSVGEASVTQPANLNRLTQPGRNYSINVVWEI